MADTTYDPKVYRKQGGSELVVASGGTITVESGGSVSSLTKLSTTAAGSALTLTSAHAGRTILLDTAAGSTVTLPAATGTGNIFRFVVSALATSNNHIVKVANATDVFAGLVLTVDTDTAGTATGWATAADSDTITLNRTTTGSVTKGEWLEITDLASGVFTVRGVVSNSGSGATPFSAAVS